MLSKQVTGYPGKGEKSYRSGNNPRRDSVAGEVNMIVSIRNRHAHSPKSLEHHARKRIAFTLDRFAKHIRSVSLRFESSANGGADKQCTVEATGQFRRAVATAGADNYYAAANRALQALERIVGKSLERQHTHAAAQ
jgi:ribosomal subunit interface protein